MSAPKPRPPYPPLPEWKWPEPGQRTWEPPEKSYFGACTGQLSCTGLGCPVGVVKTLDAGPYGCDCGCHTR